MPGNFAEGIDSWRKIIASGADMTARMTLFANAAADIAGYTARGLARAEAGDELYAIAEAHGLVEQFGADEIQRIVVDALNAAADQPKPNGANGKHHAAQTIVVPTVRPFPINGAAIPCRAWIVPGLLLRRHVSVLVAPPGSGKSLLTLQIALMMSTGTPWAGWSPRSSHKTLVINSEDDADEMRRRLYAGAKIMNCDEAKLCDRLELADAPESIIIARADNKTKTVVRTPMVENLVATIIAGAFDVVIIDPFAECFEGDENSNSELKWAAMLWREIARRTNSAVLLVHHTRKYANEPGDMDVSRGGGALLGVARVVSTVFTMSEREADAFEVEADRRHEYLRFDDAKANLNLVTFKARWFFKRTFTLPNGTDDLPADDVGVLDPWNPPSIFDKLDAATARTILLAIDFGLVNDAGAPTGDLFTLTRKGNTKRWAGKVVQDHIPNASDKDAQKALDVWHENGTLVDVEAITSTSKGKPRKGLKINMSHLPGSECML